MASDPETPTAETDENYSEILDAGWDVAGLLARLGSLQDRVSSGWIRTVSQAQY